MVLSAGNFFKSYPKDGFWYLPNSLLRSALLAVLILADSTDLFISSLLIFGAELYFCEKNSDSWVLKLRWESILVFLPLNFHRLSSKTFLLKAFWSFSSAWEYSLAMIFFTTKSSEYFVSIISYLTTSLTRSSRSVAPFNWQIISALMPGILPV